MSLSDRVIRDRYVADCSRAWESFKKSGVPKMRKKLITAVNTALRSSGVPVVTSSEDATSLDNGTFQFTNWSIVFGGQLGATGQTSEIFLASVNTVYHEARHCEQWYRIAQALAAGRIVAPIVMPQGFTRPGAGNAASIAAFMFIPLNIATEAVANSNSPLSADLVKGWFDSIYGFARAPRGNRLNDIGARYEDYRALAEERDAWVQGDTAGEEAKALYSLAYPNIYDWKLFTERSWHFRSGKFFGGDDSLKAVDAAIQTYEADRSPTNRNALKVTFNKWYAANPKERTKRDVTPPGEAEGCITKLNNWVNQDLGAAMGGFRMI